MKSDRTASSSDFLAAQELSRRLSAARPAAVRRRAAEEAPEYVRFSFSGTLARREPAPAPGPESPPAPLPPAATLDGARTWDEFLDRSLAVAEAETAFLMDEQGLLIASRGPIPASDVEGIGARLMAALEHARRMQLEEGRDPAVVVELGDAWLTGFAVPLADGSALTMGVLGASALHGEVRSRLAFALARWRASRDAPGAVEGP